MDANHDANHGRQKLRSSVGGLSGAPPAVLPDALPLPAPLPVTACAPVPECQQDFMHTNVHCTTEVRTSESFAGGPPAAPPAVPPDALPPPAPLPGARLRRDAHVVGFQAPSWCSADAGSSRPFAGGLPEAAGADMWAAASRRFWQAPAPQIVDCGAGPQSTRGGPVSRKGLRCECSAPSRQGTSGVTVASQGRHNQAWKAQHRAAKPDELSVAQRQIRAPVPPLGEINEVL